MDALASLVETVLYEGYVLWPYRRSAHKNQQRWTFGGIYPPRFVEATRAGDTSQIQADCLVLGAWPALTVEARFLQVVERRVGRLSAIEGGHRIEFVDELGSGDRRILAWDEARERRFWPGIVRVPAGEARESVHGGVIVRSWEDLSGNLEIATRPVRDGVWRVRARLDNTSEWRGEDRADAQRRGFMSAHLILHARDGRFVSSIDPPPELAAEAAGCQNTGVWPVLVGDDRTVLASPIILYDYPRVAAESRGVQFDGTEIDQLLLLNTLALTDAEKAELRATDPRAREMLERAESLSAADFMRMSGTMRPLREGGLVRLRPRPGGFADAFDIILDGKIAVVESIERDVDDRVHVAVTLVDDPGRALGAEGMPGHRFFFAPDEVESIE
jgi:hydrogenase maturation protease